uniref:Uncharacterized protein n=1 Tax=Anguilla anguilla TaxID=7936 RepID=A0A0E9XBN7_ANGAN
MKLQNRTLARLCQRTHSPGPEIQGIFMLFAPPEESRFKCSCSTSTLVFLHYLSHATLQSDLDERQKLQDGWYELKMRSPLMESHLWQHSFLFLNYEGCSPGPPLLVILALDSKLASGSGLRSKSTSDFHSRRIQMFYQAIICLLSVLNSSVNGIAPGRIRRINFY